MSNNNVIGFYKPEEENGYLSNWFLTDFRYGRWQYTSTEQFMMAQKAMVFGDYDAHRKILETTDIASIKATGRKVKNYDDAVWSRIRQHIMRCGIRAKFQQNPELLSKLLETENRILAECSPRDKIWGIGLGMNNPKIQNPEKWNGENLLGSTLMLVRSDLRKWLAISGGKIEYIDAQKLKPNDVWNMYASQVRLLPEFGAAVDVYANIVPIRDNSLNLYGEHDCILMDIELAMLTNMGGGFPAAWFWEMKQDIFDTARFSG